MLCLVIGENVENVGSADQGRLVAKFRQLLEMDL